MKLCPQCDFIYEDDQRFCDMDGKELVHDPAPVVVEASADPLSRTPGRRAGWRSRSFAVAVVAGVVLTALVIAVYFASVHQARSRAASKSSTIPAQSTSEDVSAHPAASDLESTQTLPASTALAEQPTEQSFEQLPEQSSSQPDASSGSTSLPQSSPSRESLSHARLAANLVSTKGPSGNSRGPVIVRLNNGAAIKADEAWEKKDGIWYRQAGMVTFLKRSRVRAIERVAPPARSNSTEEKNSTTRNQLRLARLEPVDTKKESRVTSFLKKTGRILKKPFRF